jgi:hypothetical protein
MIHSHGCCRYNILAIRAIVIAMKSKCSKGIEP